MAEYGRPAHPWWYSRNPRRTLLIALAVLLLCGLVVVDKGLTPVAALLGLAGLFQLGVGVQSIRRDVTQDLPPAGRPGA